MSWYLETVINKGKNAIYTPQKNREVRKEKCTITTHENLSVKIDYIVNVNIKFTKSVSLTFTSSGCYDLHLQSWTSYPLFDMTFL